MTGKTDRALPLDGYVRVSRVNGRGGETYHSPEIQREAIERLALAHGIRLDEVVVEEDVSGAKTADERELGRLVAKVEAGVSGGLVVWKVSRFSRNLLDGVETAERVREAGGRIVGSDLDTAAPMGRAILGFLLGWGEEERDLRAEGWVASQSKALSNGKRIGVAPAGYRKDADGRLRKNGHEEEIRRAFQVRADGGSWSEVARALRGVTTSRDADPDKRWSIQAARKLVTSPLYKGRLGTVAGEPVQDAALAIVAPSLWAAAQPGPGDGTAGRRQGSGRSLLSGVLRCGGCGRSLTLSTTRRGDKTYRYYCCVAGREFCQAPARCKADEVEPEVVEMALASYSGREAGADVDPELVAALEMARDAAKAEVAAFVHHVPAVTPGYADGLAERTEALDAAEEALAEEAGRSRFIVTMEEARRVYEEGTPDDRRALIRSAFQDGITVADLEMRRLLEGRA